MQSAEARTHITYHLQAKDEVKKLIEKAQTNELEAQPGRTMMESFENQVNQVLNKARDDAGKSAQNSLKDTNNVVRMVTAGSKGSFINISHVPAPASPRKTCTAVIPHHLLQIIDMRRSFPTSSSKTWKASGSPLDFKTGPCRISQRSEAP